MKKILVLLVFAFPMALAAQDNQPREDTAAMIIDRYMSILNYDALPHDSLLVLETFITYPQTNDTFVMKRWYMWPQMMRVEIWRGQEQHGGLCTNGHDRYRKFIKSLGYWQDIDADQFYDNLHGYDFRGPLYNWRINGTQLDYQGKVKAPGGQMLESVLVNTPGMFYRYYMFQPDGLLALIVETEEIDSKKSASFDEVHIEWKCMHEYKLLGKSLFPSQESFMRRGTLTVMETSAHFEARNELLFNIDKR